MYIFTVGSFLTNFGSSLVPLHFMPEYMVKYFTPVDIVSILPTPFGSPAIVEAGSVNIT